MALRKRAVLRVCALWVLAAQPFAGCVRFHARPIDAPIALSAFESRSLADSSLGRFLQASHAATAWPPRAWDLHSLTLAAFYFNPGLELARSQWGVARAAVVTAGERPNPNSTLAPGYNSSTPASQITPWILTLDLDFTLTTAGKRAYRVTQARRISEATRLAIASAAWRVRSEVRGTLLDVYAASGRAALFVRLDSVHQRNLVLLDRQLAAGAISPFEVAQARLLMGANRLALHDAQQQLAEAQVGLAAALGVTVRTLDGIAFDFSTFETAPIALPTPDVRRQALLNRADVLGALMEYEARQSALQLEVARQYPDIHLGPGYQMDQDSHKWTLGLGGLLPTFSRNRGPIAEAAARREEAAANFTNVQTRAIAQLDSALAAYQATLAKRATAEELYADRLQLLRTANTQFEAGNISRLELGGVELTLASAELSRFDARISVQQALGGLERALQSPAALPDWLYVGPRRNHAGSMR